MGRPDHGFAIPALLGREWLRDGVSHRYLFDRYAIDVEVFGVEAVYAFVTANGHVLYIGRAEVLSRRIADHERKAEARNSGATQLWVHMPGPDAAVPYDEVERRLIARYSPRMNSQHDRVQPAPAASPSAAPVVTKPGALGVLGVSPRYRY